MKTSAEIFKGEHFTQMKYSFLLSVTLKSGAIITVLVKERSNLPKVIDSIAAFPRVKGIHSIY